jgi:formylglycine-generating enzyme required for sulfatase activity
VGQFVEGNSQAGVSDLSGNVWEWTNSWLDREQAYRTIRGSSWRDNRWNARCAFRDKLGPDYFLADIGFRLFSPSSISGF